MNREENFAIVAGKAQRGKGSHIAIRGGEEPIKEIYIDISTTVNVCDMICTSLGGGSHGFQRRRKKD